MTRNKFVYLDRDHSPVFCFLGSSSRQAWSCWSSHSGTVDEWLSLFVPVSPPAQWMALGLIGVKSWTSHSRYSTWSISQGGREEVGFQSGQERKGGLEEQEIFQG